MFEMNLQKPFHFMLSQGADKLTHNFTHLTKLNNIT